MSICFRGVFIAVLSLLSCLTINNSNAQTGITNFKNSTPAQRAQFQTSMMKSKLNLSAGQLSRVQTINLKYAQKFEPIIKSSDNKLARWKQAIAIQKQKDQELQTVFTKDQFSKYQAYEAELRSKMTARFKNSN
jgi:hypothetical protein